MESQGNEVHVEADAARGGSTPNVVRWILAISLLLALIAMSAVWIIPAMTQDDQAPATVSDEYAEQQDNTDITQTAPDLQSAQDAQGDTIDGMQVEGDPEPQVDQ